MEITPLELQETEQYEREEFERLIMNIKHFEHISFFGVE